MDKKQALELINEVAGLFRDEDGNLDDSPFFYSTLADAIAKAVSSNGLPESITEALNEGNGTYKP